MNRGLNGLPAGAGLTLGSLGDVQASPTSVVAPLAVPRAGDTPSWDVGQQKYVLRRGTRWEQSANLYNARPDQFYRYRAKLAQLRMGTADLKLQVIGDSTSYGTGSTDPLLTSWPSRFAGLTSTYLKTPGTATFWPVDTTGSHWTLGTGWSGTSITTYCLAQTTATGDLTYTPPVAFDSFVVYFLRFSGNGSFNPNVDGGTSLGATSTSGSAGIVASATYSVPLGTHTIHIPPPTGGQVGIMAIEAWNSTAKSIRVFNVGAASKGTADFLPSNSATIALGKWRGLISPDLTVIALGINDLVNNTATSDTYRNLKEIVTDAQLSSDVLLMTPMPFATQANRDYLVNDTIMRLATDLDLPVLDMYSRLGSTTLESSYFGAAGHLNDTGYYDVAAGVVTALARFA